MTGDLDRETKELYWPIRIASLELGHKAVIHSRGWPPPAWHVPRSARVRLDAPGTLTLHIEPRGCALSRIELHHHRPGWTREFPADGAAMTLTEDLEAGEYVVLARGPGRACAIEVTAELHGTDGAPVPAKVHGLRYSVACE